MTNTKFATLHFTETLNRKEEFDLFDGHHVSLTGTVKVDDFGKKYAHVIGFEYKDARKLATELEAVYNYDCKDEADVNALMDELSGKE